LAVAQPASCDSASNAIGIGLYTAHEARKLSGKTTARGAPAGHDD
jgi:hypothetical protein